MSGLLVLLAACVLMVASRVTGAVPLSRYLPIGLAGQRERERESVCVWRGGEGSVSVYWCCWPPVGS